VPGSLAHSEGSSATWPERPTTRLAAAAIAGEGEGGSARAKARRGEGDGRRSSGSATTCSRASLPLLLLILGPLVTVWVVEKPGSLEKQRDEIEQAANGRHVVVRKQLKLHGSDLKSFLYVFRDDTIGRPETAADTLGQRSDRVEIYDFKPSGLFQRKKLVRKFVFEPKQPGSQLGVHSTRDWDGDGHQEVVGSYWTLSERRCRAATGVRQVASAARL
jgi:hypothetical protein